MEFAWIRRLSVVFALFASSSVFAGGLELEPYAGYALDGTSGTKASFTAKQNDTFKMIGLGARLNVKLGEALFLAPDFSYLPGLSATSISGTVKSGNIMRLGLTAGLRIASFRVWGGYNFLDSNNASMNNATYGDFKTAYAGSSFKVGAGFKLASRLNLNAEYFFINYTKLTATVSGVSAVTTLSGASAVTGNQLLVSLSLMM